MGRPIARRLAAAGILSVVWNRTPRADHTNLGVPIATSPRDAGADVVLAILPDVPHLREVLDAGLSEALSARRGILAVMSTSSPLEVVRLGEELEALGVRVVDAPMSGGDSGARDGTLSLMVGGTSDDVDELRPVFDTIATSIEHFGALGSGSLAKLCNQLVVASTLTATAEALALGSRSGLDERQLARALSGGLADSAVLRTKGAKLIDRDYSLGGSLANQVKDLTYALEWAEAVGLELPLATSALRLFAHATEMGLGERDHTSIREVIDRRGGRSD